MPHDKVLALYTAYRHQLVAYAHGIVGDPARAEDVVQEAFLRFKIAAAGRLLEEPVGYLYRIVRNLAFDGRRHAMLERQHLDGSEDRRTEEIAADVPSPEAAASAREELARVMAAMAELPERTRIALEMHRLGGCKLREIAEHLGISVSMAQLLVVEGVRHCQRRL